MKKKILSIILTIAMLMTSTPVTQVFADANDNLTWQELKTGIISAKSIAYGNGVYVKAGDNGVETSADGISWTKRSSTAKRKVIYADGQFVTLEQSGGSNTVVYTSPDGINWTYRAVLVGSILYSLTYADGQYVAVGMKSSKAVSWTSPDGIEWTEHTQTITDSFHAVTYGNGQYVAVGGNASGATIYTSIDGVDWTSQTVPASGILRNISYLNNLFVAIGDNGTILTSADTENWTKQTSGTTNRLTAVTYGEGEFVIVGNTRTVLTSSDAENWTIRTDGGFMLEDIIYANNQFVSVGSKVYIGYNATPSSLEIGDMQIQERSNIQINTSVTDQYNFSMSSGYSLEYSVADEDVVVVDNEGNITANKYSEGANATVLTVTETTSGLTKDVNITVNQAYFSAVFNVTDGTNPLEGCEISFDGKIASTDFTGTATFEDVAISLNIPYTITKPDFIEETGTIDIVDADVTEDVIMTPASYSISLTVNTEGLPIGGAEVELEGDVQSTDSDGIVVFSDYLNGTYSYTVTKAVYDSVSGTIEVANADVNKVIDLTASTFTVDFTVRDEDSNALEEAEISFDGQVATTDKLGQASFFNVAIGGNQPYTVSKVGYDIANGTVDVIDQDVSEDVTLSESTYSITFNVTSDGSSPIQEATVTFDFQSKNTSASGQVSFNSVAIGNYNYEISKEGYENATGTIDVLNADVMKNVTLVAIPVVPEQPEAPEQPPEAPASEGKSSGSSRSSGGGGSSSSAPTVPAPTPTPEPITTVTTEDGTVETTVTEQYIQDALQESNQVVIDVEPANPGATEYTQTLPESAVTQEDSNYTIEINTPVATVTVPSNMIPKASGSSGGGKVGIGIKGVSGYDKPAIDLTASVNNAVINWSNPEALVFIQIPYNPLPTEDIQNIMVAYIVNGDIAKVIDNATYNSSTGKVEFWTTHFSEYKVIYGEKIFTDTENHWARKAIGNLAYRGVVNGIGNNMFAPNANITRADFVSLLVRMFGFKADFISNFDDVQKNAYYYSNIGIAKSIGITNGIDNKMFDPRAYITRQDMLVMLNKALQITNKNLTLQGTDISSYVDVNEVSNYAVDSMRQMVAEGIIKGNNNKLQPKDYATRAETATILYRVLQKYLTVQ